MNFRLKRRRAFTLVEAIVATGVLSVLAVGIFRVFRSTNRSASLMAFTSAAQKELRNGLKRVHDDLSKAPIYNGITRSSVMVLDPETGAELDTSTASAEETALDRFAVLVDGTPDDPKIRAPGAGSQDLMYWYQCVPRRTGFSADEQEEGYSISCKLFLEGNTLVLQKDPAHNPDGAAQSQVIELMHNVKSVTTAATETADTDGPLVGSEVTLEVSLMHPNEKEFPNSVIQQSISARVPVSFKPLTGSP